MRVHRYVHNNVCIFWEEDSLFCTPGSSIPEQPFFTPVFPGEDHVQCLWGSSLFFFCFFVPNMD